MTDSHWASAYLSRVAEAPSGRLAALVRSVGVVEAAERVRRGAVDAEQFEQVRGAGCLSAAGPVGGSGGAGRVGTFDSIAEAEVAVTANRLELMTVNYALRAPA